MEIVSELPEGGEMDKDDNLIGIMPNRNQAVEHVTKCAGKFRQMNKTCSTA